MHFYPPSIFRFFPYCLQKTWKKRITIKTIVINSSQQEFRRKRINCIYYIDTSEIPSELCRENFISSHMKRSPSLWLHNKSHLWKQADWYFTGRPLTNRILHTCSWIWILSSCIQLYISLVRCAHSWDIELTTRR